MFTIKTILTGALLVFGQTLSAQDCSGYSYGMNVPVSPAEACGCNGYGRIDYLYWKPYEDGINWGTAVLLDVAETELTERLKYGLNATKIKFDWDSGFRVGLGLGFPCDKWALSLDWTHYRTCVNKSLLMGSPPNSTETESLFEVELSVLFPPFYPGDSLLWNLEDDTIITSALSGQWKLQLNQVDLELDRNFYVGQSVSLRPHVGLSYLNITQNMFVDIEYNGSIVEGPPLTQEFNGRYQCSYKGVGLRAGLDSNWEILCGVGIFGEWAFNTYYGTFRTDTNTLSHQSINSESFDGPKNSLIEYRMGDKFQALRLTNDLSVGFSWMSRFNCDKNTLFVKAGWEHHTYFGQNMFTSAKALAYFNDDVATNMFFVNNNLYLYGFVFSAALSF